MKIFDGNISLQVSEYLNSMLRDIDDFIIANALLLKSSGIINFFNNAEDFECLKNSILEPISRVSDPDRTEYGDFQTNFKLSLKCVSIINEVYPNPDILIEPTSGVGNFIISALNQFKNLKYIYAIEIHKPYIWETKFNILEYFLSNKEQLKPTIEIIHYDVFDFDFSVLAKKHIGENIVIVGNPPWVTNSQLGSLNSSNLPQKSNFKNHNGIDAITGKGNFDIGEYIVLMLLNAFQKSNGYFSLLIKNSVIKNIIQLQKSRSFTIADIKSFSIDSKKEFDVSVEASFFLCKLNSEPEYFCSVKDIYKNSSSIREFGWVEDKFVSNLELYKNSYSLDGRSPLVWRQGIKHDCSNVMELNKNDNYYINNLNEKINLEEELIYGLLKSSDLKNFVINKTRKFTIVPQKNVGDETKYIEKLYPLTYNYLKKNIDQFDSRKSIIYKNKPKFSIFGIGDYSFMPFKVAISGLYKDYNFSLVLPFENKPIMLDDTCYFIGFDNLEYAAYTLIILNSEEVMNFLKSITFCDAKRMFTKDILMRIDLFKSANNFPKSRLNRELNLLNSTFNLSISLEKWDNYINEFLRTNDKEIQLNMFNSNR